MGSGGVGSSRGTKVVAVLELHKDEEIYMLVGQRGEHACIKSMGIRDKDCEPRNKNAYDPHSNSKTKLVKNLLIEDGAGGGGGATYIFLLNTGIYISHAMINISNMIILINHSECLAGVAVPIIVGAGGGGLGIGRYFTDQSQHGHGMDLERLEFSGQRIDELNKTGGPGGGWRARPDQVVFTEMGAALLQGGRGGESCYANGKAI